MIGRYTNNGPVEAPSNILEKKRTNILGQILYFLGFELLNVTPWGFGNLTDKITNVRKASLKMLYCIS